MNACTTIIASQGFQSLLKISSFVMMTRHLVYRNDATVAVLLWMTRVHDFAGSWALVSHKKLHIWAWPLIPIQPWHMGGFNQPHIHHASWHLQAGP